MSGLREAEETYRRMAYDTFAQDLKMGFNLRFCRTFAVPEIARVLAATGRMTQHTRVRTKATGATMYGLRAAGAGPGGGVSQPVARPWTMSAVAGYSSR